MRSTARLTRPGYGALGIGAVMGVAGLRLGYPGVAGFGLALLGFVVLALVALQTLPPLELRRETSPAAPRRLDECTVTLTVRNRSRRAARLEGLEIVGTTELAVNVPYVTPGRKVQICYPLPTQRRGPVTLGPLRLRRIGLAGLAVGEVSLPVRHPVTVLPRVLAATGSPGPLTVLLDNRAASYPPDTPDFDEAVDVAASLVAAAGAAGFSFAVRTALRSGPTEPVVGDGNRVATTIGQLAVLPLARPAVRAQLRSVEGGVAVGVTGSTGDQAPLLAALSSAGRAVLLVVDRRPDRMVAAAGNVLTLRAPRAEELLVAWAEVAPGIGGDTAPRSRLEIA